MKNSVNQTRQSRSARAIVVRDLEVSAADASAVKAGIFNAFAKPADITGEAEGSAHDKGWIDVRSYSHGGSW
jgi:ActR/RegA family two-component response regulator